MFVYKEVTSNDTIISSSSMGISDIIGKRCRILGVIIFMFNIKALLVKSLRELLIITAYLSYSNKRKLQISKRKRSK